MLIVLLLTVFTGWAQTIPWAETMPENIINDLQSAAAQNDLDKVILILNNAIKTTNDQMLLNQYKTIMAATYERAGDRLKAFGLYYDLVKNNIEDRNALYCLGSIYELENSFDDRINALITDLPDKSHAKRYLQLLFLIKQKRYSDAKTLCNDLIRNDPNNVIILIKALQLAASTGDQKMARDAISTFKRLGFQMNIVILKFVAMYSDNKDEREKALKTLRQIGVENATMDSDHLGIDLLSIRLEGAGIRLELFPFLSIKKPSTENIDKIFPLNGYHSGTSINLIPDMEHIINIVPRDGGLELKLFFQQYGQYYFITSAELEHGGNQKVLLPLPDPGFMLRLMIKDNLLYYSYIRN
jgi:tetratricopeptide (TPR) repeat protein